MQKMAVTRDRVKALHIREGEMGVGENYKSLCQTLASGETQKACRLIEGLQLERFLFGSNFPMRRYGHREASHFSSQNRSPPGFLRFVRSPGHCRHGQQIQA